MLLFYMRILCFIVVYQHYHYSICVSNKKIHVSKIKHDPNSLLENHDDSRVSTDTF